MEAYLKHQCAESSDDSR